MPESTRPHLLLLMSDQHNPAISGYAGDPRVVTPTLDALASAGTTFATCYSNHPLCVPSRMSLLTSRHSHQLGIWGNSDALSSNVPTLAHSLGIAGYRTVLAGRMHFIGGDQYHGFQERLVGDVSSGNLGVNRAEYRSRGFFGIAEALFNAGPGLAHDLNYDTAVAMDACRLIRDHDESGDPRPLCLMVSLYSPHDPYRVHERYYRPYAENADLPADCPPASLHPLNRQIIEGNHFDEATEAQVKAARAAYRGKVTFMDELFGAVVETWRESRLGEDAAIAYFSDHGEMLGEHGLWGKSTFYEASALVPLILHAPGRIPAGRRIQEPVSLLDLVPTLLDLVDAEALPDQRGQSLLPPLAGEGAWPEVIYSELTCGGNPSRMVRRGPWKLNTYDGHAPELFNLLDDPGELHDRAADPASSAILRELLDLVTADGWSPAAIRSTMAERRGDYEFLARWTQAVNPRDWVQWGIPAPL